MNAREEISAPISPPKTDKGAVKPPERNVQIRQRYSDDVLFEGDYPSVKMAVAAAGRAGVSLENADLREADLMGAGLGGARLEGAYLGSARLAGADLIDAGQETMSPRRVIEIDAEAADAVVVAVLSDAAILQFKPEYLGADPPDTALIEAIMRVLRFYCSDDQYAEIAAMIEELSPPDDAAVERVARAVAVWKFANGTRDWEDVDDYDRDAARVAITAYREVML